MTAQTQGRPPMVPEPAAGIDPRLINDDLAPARSRDWGFFSLFAMWMSDIHSIGGYTFAAGLFALGLGAAQVFTSLSVGIVIVFLLMNLVGFAGQKTGLCYPVLARITFGTIGSNLPALLRGFVAICWYGIQTWLASRAVIVLVAGLWPGVTEIGRTRFLGETLLGWAAFILMWALQLLLLRKGMETIRRFQDWAGPAVWVVVLILTVYVLKLAGWHVSFDLATAPSQWGTAHAVLAAISLTVAYFATLMLNFCDFSRFSPTRRAVWLANLWGLPVNFIAFSVVSVLVTAGSMQIYGEYIFDPVDLVARLDHPVAIVLGAIHLHRRHPGHQRRGELRVPGLRPRQRLAVEDHLPARRRHLRLHRAGHDAVEPLQQPLHHQRVPRGYRRRPRTALLHHHRRLLHSAQAAGPGLRAVQGAGGALLRQRLEHARRVGLRHRLDPLDPGRRRAGRLLQVPQSLLLVHRGRPRPDHPPAHLAQRPPYRAGSGAGGSSRPRRRPRLGRVLRPASAPHRSRASHSHPIRMTRT